MRFRWRTVLPVVLMIVACNEPTYELQEASFRDSAGIRIVENTRPELDSVLRWRLSSSPSLEIGSRNRSVGESLFFVRDVARTSTKIVVLNAGTQELRYFDEFGQYLHSTGRRGAGPGEFEGLYAVQVLGGDSIIAYDVVTGAASVFDADGKHVSTTILSPRYASSGVIVLGRRSDGTYLTRGETHAQQLGLGPGRVTGRAVITRLNETGEPLGDVIEFADRETMALIVNGRPTFLSAPFGKRHLSALVVDDLVLGHNHTFELRYLGADGNLQRIVRKLVSPSVVTSEHVERYRERYRETHPDRANQVLPLLEFPETHPAYVSLTSDTDGNIWVQTYQASVSEGPEEWSVFDADGRWVTDIQTPESYSVMHIDSHQLLGVWRDDLGVEYVRGYELVKPSFNR